MPAGPDAVWLRASQGKGRGFSSSCMASRRPTALHTPPVRNKSLSTLPLLGPSEIRLNPSANRTPLARAVGHVLHTTQLPSLLHRPSVGGPVRAKQSQAWGQADPVQIRILPLGFATSATRLSHTDVRAAHLTGSEQRRSCTHGTCFSLHPEAVLLQLLSLRAPWSHRGRARGSGRCRLLWGLRPTEAVISHYRPTRWPRSPPLESGEASDRLLAQMTRRDSPGCVLKGHHSPAGTALEPRPAS